MNTFNKAMIYAASFMLMTNSARANLISVPEDSVVGYWITHQLLSARSSEKDSGEATQDSINGEKLLSDIEKLGLDAYIRQEAMDEFDIEDILSRLDLSESEEVLYDDHVIKNYTYRAGMDDVYRRINDDAVSVIDRYMQRTTYIPVKDPLWFLALGAIEYGYANDSDIICSWPVNVNDYMNEPDYFLSYNWQTVRDMLGADAVTRRTGGAVGPFQIESFYGKGVSPVLPDEFGLIGAAENRQDCWVTLGAGTDSGSSIIWQQGTYADRWSIADSANICLGVYDETLRRVNGQCALTELTGKYEQVTFLMWAHNRGTGILGNHADKETVKSICAYTDAITERIYSLKPDRFRRSPELTALVNEICSEVGCAEYPVMSLIAYLIVEARYAGAW